MYRIIFFTSTGRFKFTLVRFETTSNTVKNSKRKKINKRRRK